VTDLYSLPLQKIDGSATTLAPYRGKALLIVNVASQCGFTPQYKGLETLYQTYHDRGLVVLGFPCNQFGHQEPGSDEDIQTFCDRNYGVTFPMFAKIDVNGPHAHPLYRHLKAAKKGLFGREAIAWNFTKFLVGRDGEVLRRYGPRRTPEAIGKDLASLV
jgi:glutathione peroxidase